MTRRTLLLALATRPRDRFNDRCERAGRHRERHGLTERERAYLKRRGCKQEGGSWMSDRVWEA